MSNKNVTPTFQTIRASENFAEWLNKKMRQRGVTCAQLAEAIGCERKAIVSYRTCGTLPRLDAVAAIFAYFGEDEISIPLTFCEILT